MERQSGKSLADTLSLKLGRLGKTDIKLQNMRTIYKVHKFFKDISEQSKHFRNTNLKLQRYNDCNMWRPCGLIVRHMGSIPDCICMQIFPFTD